LRKYISDGRTATDIARRAMEEGMIDFRRAALIKVAQGITSFDEMQRTLPNVEEALLSEP
jgi:type II secretory ATPase GspE/PulE/Tfp pilus assembly ATPase PilB-like protein